MMFRNQIQFSLVVSLALKSSVATAAPICPLPEDVQDWMTERSILEILANWPPLMRKGPVWEAFVATASHDLTLEQMALIAACPHKQQGR